MCEVGMVLAYLPDEIRDNRQHTLVQGMKGAIKKMKTERKKPPIGQLD
jgi:hypothetical protein